MNKNGERILSDKEVSRCREAYGKLSIACAEYLKGKGNARSSELGHERLIMAKAIGQLADADFEALKNTTAADGRTLSEIILAGRRITVDITGMKAQNVGGNLSSRTMIKNVSEGLDGFFTPTETAQRIEERFKGIYKKHFEKETNQKYQKYIKFLAENHGKNIYSGLTAAGILAKKEERKKDYETGSGDFAKSFSNIGQLLSLEFGRKTAKDLIGDAGFRMAMYDFILESVTANNSWRQMNEVAGVQSGTNIERRNVAMSVVAGLVGTHDLVAHSKTMTLKDGEKEIQGVYMERARGLDATKMGEEPDFFKGNVYDTPEVKKQAADMQVIDFICGNTDRHAGNIFYEFTGEPPRLTKLTGIDNDCSFGLIDGEVSTDRFTTLDNMFVMREETARTVLGLTKDSLRYALHGLIEEDEIEAAWMRTESMQNVIRSDATLLEDGEVFNAERGTIRLLRDDDWEKIPLENLKLSNLAKGKYNCFDMVSYVQQKAANFDINTVKNKSEGKAAEAGKAPTIINRQQLESEPLSEPDAIYADIDEFVKKHGCEPIFDENGRAHGINFVKDLGEGKPFYRISDKDGMLTEFRFEKTDAGVKLLKTEADEKSITKYDFSAASLSINNMLKTLNDVDPSTLVSSAEFSDLKKSVAGLSKELSNHMKDNGEGISKEDLNKKLENARKNALRYIHFKEARKAIDGVLKPITVKRVNAVATVLDGLEKLCNAKLGDASLENATKESRGICELENYINGIKGLCPDVKENLEALKAYTEKKEYKGKFADNSAGAELITKAMTIKLIQSGRLCSKEANAAIAINALYSENENTKKALNEISQGVLKQIESNAAAGINAGDTVRQILEDPRLMKTLCAKTFEKVRKAPAQSATSEAVKRDEPKPSENMIPR